MVHHDGKVKVTRKESGKHKKTKTSSVQEGVEVKRIEGPVANVGYGISYTMNLGDYNSLKVDVSVHLPCPPDRIRSTFKEAKQFSHRRLQEEIGEMNDFKKSRR